MIKLGVNSVLFKAFSFREAAEAIKKCGYDGVEISAIGGMCEHLNLADWKNQKAELIAIREELDLPFLSTEVASQDRARLNTAFEACAEIGIPIVNIGPGGKMNDEDTMKTSLETIQILAEDAEKFGITLCVKAHVGAAVFSTPTTLRMMDTITSPAFGVDMDPSHIHRAGENPAVALPAVLSKMKHIHIRDCKGEGPSPGDPTNQACGRGDIDLYGYFKAMVDQKYNGPVCLEVIGPEQTLADATRIAAESYGYMNAVLKMLGAR
ncbi:MAG: sugar phosphate isomerase/epimerase [Clostridia bacterium]|nr:sugar phosphate isomerase/epimerase [Clostridia bacterium]MBQ8370762.1 sugar phosphate isomerase/epimerase [Clostridia bacterium]MBQ8512749.1 sugar phosphate isomerase/epimerase [Clostridia bacterium]